MLTPYEPYLRQRWAEGCHNGVRLHRELVARGFSGSRVHVARLVAQFRREPGALTPGTEPAPAAIRHALTPRDAAMLVLRRPDQRTADGQAALASLGRSSGAVGLVLGLSQRWLQLFRERQGSVACNTWLADAVASGIPELSRFATKVRQDEAAVKAAGTETWSNGQTEGQITKLKLSKRTMYGRPSSISSGSGCSGPPERVSENEQEPRFCRRVDPATDQLGGPSRK